MFMARGGDAAANRRLLADLEDAWRLYNKPHVDYGLRCSISTRLSEVRARVEADEKEERKREAATRRRVRRAGGKSSCAG